MAQGDLTDALRFAIETGTVGEVAHIIGEEIGDAIVVKLHRDRREPAMTAEQAREAERNRIAELAMQGMLAGETEEEGIYTPEGLARRAYAFADAMLAEREKKAGQGS